MQSQVKPSHCCKQTPWLAQDSSVQVVLGPEEAGGTPQAQPSPSLPRRYGSFGAGLRPCCQLCQAERGERGWRGGSRTSRLGLEL